MEIFGGAKIGEEMDKINYSLTQVQLEHKPINPTWWDVHHYARGGEL